jgi:hypothetical protein
MAGIFTDVWRIVKPAPPKSGYVYANPEDMKLYSNFSWYTKVMKGASSRFSKYTQFKNMDNDVFVARALDTIAEEMSQIDIKTDLPFEIVYQNEADEEVPEHIVTTVRAALRHWSDIQDLSRLLFDITRTTVKYGDCFFRKTSDFKKWQYIDPADVIGVSLQKDTGQIEFYQLRTGDKNKQGAFGDVEHVPAAGIVHFSLSSNMGDSGPFGESVLTPVIKAYRHLSLLEDAVIIYRIVRAPERRVFMIDVGNMPPQRARAYLESIKNEIRQKRVPNESGGQEKIDSVYNPMSMTEDYFFMQTAEGRGSKVDTLSGGENLGEISDLNYFQNRFLQGLRIPSSYMRGSNDNGAQIQDGKVGVAYIEELRFANYISRLQSKLDTTFDKHFKAYLKSAGININHQLFKIKLNDPQNFKDYKRAEVDEKLISNFNNLKDVKFISKRYLLQHYLGWSEDEIQVNEAMLKQEMAIPEGGIAERLGELRMMYDDKWLEGRPDIKVAETYEDFTAETTKQEAGDNDDEKAPPEDGEGKPDDAGADTGDDEAADKAEGGNDKEDKGAEGSEDKKGEGESDASSEEPRSLGSLDKDING